MGVAKSAVAHPTHMSNSHTKLGWISSNGLGGGSITDRRTHGQTGRGDYNTLLKGMVTIKAEHHVTRTNWIPLYIHNRKAGS